MMEVKEVLRKTDWSLLQRQKMELLKQAGDDSILIGLVNWIDTIQDAAVEEGIAEEGEVFPQLDD